MSTIDRRHATGALRALPVSCRVSPWSPKNSWSPFHMPCLVQHLTTRHRRLAEESREHTGTIKKKWWRKSFEPFLADASTTPLTTTSHCQRPIRSIDAEWWYDWLMRWLAYWTAEAFPAFTEKVLLWINLKLASACTLQFEATARTWVGQQNET